ncbi:glycosyltransferase family 9 protein [bacterium]|nr:glycosyltransferase family 9 protein [bacterium]
MPGKKHRLLIISLSGMGDALLFTPALHMLRERLPCAEITMLVKSDAAAQALTGNQDIDHVKVFDPQSASIFRNIRFYLRQRNECYDLSISTFPALTALNNISTWLIGARHRWVHHPPNKASLAFLQNHTVPYNHGSHRVEYNMQIADAVIHYLDGLPYNGNENSPPLNMNAVRLFYYISPEEDAFAQKFLQGLTSDMQKQTAKGRSKGRTLSHKIPCLIGIHPGSGSDQSFKRWPEKKYASLASILQDKFEARILIFGGPDEVAIAKAIADRMHIPPIILTGKMGLRHMAAIIKYCRLFISNDSGLMHLAVALGTQAVGIFGPTDETNTRPTGERDKVAVLSHLPCKPGCQRRFLFDKHCPNQYRCMKGLNVKDVLAVIPEIL